MPKQSVDQRGFSLVETLLVIITLALVVFVSYYVYHGQKHTNAAQNAPAATSQSTKNTASTSSKTSYLVIKEWGVEVPLGAGISDAVYTTGGSSNTVNVSRAAFTGDCGIAVGGVGKYFRYKTGDVDSYNGEQYSDEAGEGVVIGAYHYVFIGEQSACSSDGALQDQASAAASAFGTAALGFRAVQ